MKKYLNIIFIGAASWTKNDKRFGGQIPYIKDIINEYVTVIASDPEHKNETDKYLQDKSGVPICRGSSPNIVSLKALNVFHLYASELFQQLVTNNDTYYLVFVFNGIEREMPSFNIAKKMNIKNRFFWNTDNALFLGMGCLCKPFPLKEFVNKLDIFSKNNILSYFFELQKTYYAFQNNIDALSRAYLSNEIPSWAEKSLYKLRHIGINTLQQAHNYYENVRNYRNIGIEKLIKEELKNLELLSYWDERDNDF